MIARFPWLAGTATIFIASAAQAQPPATQASAQAAEPPPAAAPAVEEVPPPLPENSDITVTARRRAESLQTIPLAVSVVGGEQIAKTGTFNVGRLAQIQPTIQFYSTNPRNSAANIRGLGAPFGLTNDGIEQGVGIYVDQVYYSRIASATFDFLDIDRIEVLRGPQGTLYGKNTTAGALNLTSRAPSFDPEARVELSYGNLDFFQAKASVSGPIVDDRLAIRLAGSLSSRRGTIYNVTSDKWVNAIDNIGLRSQLLWNAAPNLKLTLAGDYSRQNPECCAQIYVRVGATQRPLNRQFEALAAAFGYVPPSRDPFDRITDLDTPLDARQTLGGASLRAEWDLGPGILTSVSAWRFWNWHPSNDRDFIGLPITSVSANPSKQKQWTQELRYGSAGQRRLDYTIGLFAFHQTIHTSGSQVQGPAASRWLLNPGNVPPGSSGCNPATANACNPAVLSGLTSTNDIHFSNTSLAAYGQLSWHVTDRLRLQPGLRLNYDKKKGSYIATVTTGSGSTILNNDQRGVLAPQSYQPEFSDWNLSGDFTISYDAARDVLAYATYAKAFKSGGINLSGLPLDAANQPILSAATVKPEDVDHLELGLKTQLLRRKAILNLAAFWTEIRDYQATVTNSQYAVLRGYLANADKVRVRGVELDFSAHPAERLSLYANAAFTDGRYVKFTDAPCPPELSGGSAASATNPPSPAGTPGGASPANCDISGQWLPGISRWAASYGGEYALPEAHFAGIAAIPFIGIDGSYRSKFSSNPSRSVYTDIDGYGLVAFRLGFSTPSGWELSTWIRNAFDAHYFEVLATQSGSTGLVVGQPGDPRTYGFAIRGRF